MRMPARRETVTAGPPPRLVVETGPTFPAWTARAALLLLATGFGAAALQTTGLAPSFVWGVALGLGIVTAYLSRGHV